MRNKTRIGTFWKCSIAFLLMLSFFVLSGSINPAYAAEVTNEIANETDTVPPIVSQTEYTVKRGGEITIPYDNTVYTDISCEMTDSKASVKVDTKSGTITLTGPSYSTGETTLRIYTAYGRVDCKVYVKDIFAFDSEVYHAIRGENYYLGYEISGASSYTSSDSSVIRISGNYAYFSWLRYKLYDSNGKLIASKKF